MLSLSSKGVLKFLIAGVVVAAVASVSLGEEETTANTTAAIETTIPILRQPDLPFGDINILVVSDVHSFVGGHPHEIDRNADYGDLLSFHERLVAHCDERPEVTGDLWLFNNGDFLHGTGLAMDGNATNLLPIVSAMPWDSMAMGRQEATYSDVLRDMKESLLPALPGKYITSNVVDNSTREPFGGQRYQLLRGKNSTLLVFGFLYDTVSSTSETIEVLSIEETLQQDWFTRILRQDEDESYDAIVVMAHMDNYSPLIDTIYEAIRANVDPQMPIQFIAGHSHKRERTTLTKKDHYVHRIEPGGLFDTIGWVTIPKFDTAKQFPARGKSDALEASFRMEFLNTSKTELRSRLGSLLEDDEDLSTDQGKALSERIETTRERLGLNQIVACPGHDYFRNISIHDDASLWKLWREHVVRTEIFQKDEDRVMLVSKSTFRYDLRGSGRHDAMTLDDVVAIAPYMEKVVYVGDVPDWMIRRMNNTFNTFSHHNIIPDFVLAGDLNAFKTAESYHLYTHEVDLPKIKTKLEKFNFHDFVLEYTGQRDTLYWLDYLQSAFPCTGKQAPTKPFEAPYFYDPNELEEEATDGKVTTSDSDNDDDDDDDHGGGNTNTNNNDNGNNNDNNDIGNDIANEETWTLPPNEGYMGYVPGKGNSEEIPSAVYENYKSKEEREQEAKQKKAEAAKHSKYGNGPQPNQDLGAQIRERKKRHKKIIKGFAITFACGLLLVPFVCLVLQVVGKNEYLDDYNDTAAFGNNEGGLYDREEMKLLKRYRRRGMKPPKDKHGIASLHSAPFQEIEII
jgi:hypothetical protein